MVSLILLIKLPEAIPGMADAKNRHIHAPLDLITRLLKVNKTV